MINSRGPDAHKPDSLFLPTVHPLKTKVFTSYLLLTFQPIFLFSDKYVKNLIMGNNQKGKCS